MLTILGITWAFFTATIAGQMSRIPNLPTSIIHAQTIGGAATSVYLSLPGYLLLVATYRLERAAEITQMLHDLSIMLIAMTVMPLVVQDFAFSYAVLQDRRERPLVPRWMAWVSFALSMCYWFVLGVPMVKSGPMAWNGVLAFWIVAIAGFAEYVLISVFLWKAVGRTDIPADGESRVEMERM